VEPVKSSLHYMSLDLQGLRVLVTRPAAQAASLMATLQQAGARPHLFPLLEIDAVSSPPLQQQLKRLAQFDIALFISPNAVNYALDALGGQAALPADLQLATVGKGSARALRERTGRDADICPDAGFDSEALLAHPALQQLSGKQVLIFRGQGGRETLAEGLRQRGAEVSYAEVYRRRCPQHGGTSLNAAIAGGELDLLLITSNQALACLIKLVNPAYQAQLRQLAVLVVHPCQATRVAEYQFSQAPLLAASAGDADIVSALQAAYGTS